MTVEEVDFKDPNPAIIELLENMLKDAKSGDLQGVAVLGLRNDCMTSSAFVCDYYPQHLIGELRILERDIIDCCVETRRQPMWEFCE